jgi:hypothetical protein
VAGPLASVERKLINAILDRIRSRREEASTLPVDQHPHPPVAVSPAKLREALFSDFEPVRELKRRWGLIPDSFENWERLWLRNPALQETPFAPPIGWVLEAEGRPVGYLGNVPSLYRYGSRTLTAVTGHGFVVEPAHRAVSLTLMAAFFRQKPVDLYLTTTAIAVVGKIARVFKSDSLPQPDYEKVLFWVLRPRPFAQYVMEKLQLRPAYSAAGSVLASLAIGADKTFRRRWPRRRGTPLAVKEILVAEIGEDFQSLWAKKLMEGPRLLADRSPATLRWHFQTPGDCGTTSVLSCYRGRELVGYAVIRDDPSDTAGLRRSIIADMLVERDAPEILTALFVAAYDHAKDAGSHILEVLGFPESVRRVCLEWNPYSRKYPACPFFYKAADPVLHRELANSVMWYASPFDGDTTLMPLLAEPDGQKVAIERKTSSKLPADDRTGTP